MNTQTTKTDYVKSIKGLDFARKPIDMNTKTDKVFAWWGGRVFFIGEMRISSCDLYTVKDEKPVFAFNVSYKNITLIKKKEDELQQS